MGIFVDCNESRRVADRRRARSAHVQRGEWHQLALMQRFELIGKIYGGRRFAGAKRCRNRIIEKIQAPEGVGVSRRHR